MRQIEHVSPLDIRKQPRWRQYLIDSALAVIGTLAITGIVYVLQLYPRIPNISLIYLLIVLALASTRGLYAAVLSAIVAFLSFDYFLIPPYYTFNIARFEEWLALIVFLATAIITGELAALMRQRAEQAHRRERETRILYDLVRATNSEEHLERQLDILARTIVEVFGSWGIIDCRILLPDVDAGGKLVLQASTSPDEAHRPLSPDEAATASWVMEQSQTVELHDVELGPPAPSGYTQHAVVKSTLSAKNVRRYTRMIPLKIGQKVVGVVSLMMEDDPHLFAHEHIIGVEREHSNSSTAFFWTFLDQAASMIERMRLRRENMRVEVLQRTDELRAALLSSASHDLRTPLSSIKASASSLLQTDVEWDEEARRSFILAIEREADRLNRLVGNLLDMSRIEGGALKPEKEWYPVDELLHDVLGHMQPLLQGRNVQIDIPDDLPPVEVDYLHIDQVVTNLLENAVSYTPPETPIEISARADSTHVTISIADRGLGIPPADRQRIFDKFYRLPGTQHHANRVGSGLGLAVCKGLVEANGGHIWVENRSGSGSVFRFTLPVGTAEEFEHE